MTDASGPDPSGRMAELAFELRKLRDTLYDGGGAKRIQLQHDQGKLTARERVHLLLDDGEPWVELGLLVAHDLYDGQAPGAGVVTGVGRVAGREVVVVANDATVKGGSWWPETITKMLRAQEVAMRCRVPIVYLVDSAGVSTGLDGSSTTTRSCVAIYAVLRSQLLWGRVSPVARTSRRCLMSS